MKYIIALMLLFKLVTGFSQGEEELSMWQLLGKIKFKQVYSEREGGLISAPVFSGALKEMEGKEVIILGYYLPFDMPAKNQMIISFNPYASCFFCGGGGPESIVEVELKESIPKLKVDELVRVKGKLKFNDSDWNRMIFIIENAEILERI